MIEFVDFLQSEIVSDMAVSLLHTLWQGAIIAGLLLLVLKGISGRHSELRYRLSVFSLFFIVVCWLGTFSLLQYEAADKEEPAAADSRTAANIIVKQPVSNAYESEAWASSSLKAELQNPAPGQSSAATIDTAIDAPVQTTAVSNAAVDGRIGYAAWAMLVWAAGVCVMLGRVLFALGGAAKLRREAVDIDDPDMVELFADLCRQMGIRRMIRFAASKTLAHPGVVGFWRPVLLVPLSILSEISVDDLRAILAHELAHIRRLDYLVNFCQMVVEAVLFFNPAVWWVSRRIRIEREACCDAAGVAAAGQRTNYARILFEQITRTAGAGQTAAVAMTGFSDSNAGSCEERINRIIHPQHKPRMKVGWVKAACWLMATGLILLGLFKTTDFAIAMAARILTPAERIEKMQQIHEAYSQVDNSVFDEEDVITVRGQLFSEDGGELPFRIRQNCQGQESRSINIEMEISPYVEGHGWPKINPDGSYEFQTRLKRFYVILRPRSDYAVSFLGPFEFDPNELVEDFDLPLHPGFTGGIQFINENNEPVENVQVTGGYPTPPEYNSWTHTIKASSGNDGVAVIEHASDELANFSCEVPGYVKEPRHKIRLVPDEPYVWQLTSTPSTVIRVVADANDQPISGIAVNVSGKEYWQIDSYNVDRPVFTTDDDGWVQLESLSESEDYLILVHGKGYQRQYTHVQGGGDVVVRLKEFQPIQGKITGDLSGLKKDETGSYFEFSNVVRLRENSTSSDWSGDNKVYVDIIDDEAYFQIEKYYGHQINIRLGSKTHKIDINRDDISHVVIDIPLPSSYKKKAITFNFVDAVSSEILSFTGKFKLSYRDNPNDYYVKNHDIEIVEGKATVEITLPNHISWQPTSRTGWFFYRKWKDITNDYSGTEKIECYPAGAIYGNITNPSGYYSNVYMNIHTVKKSPLLDKNYSQTPIVEFEQNITLNPEGSYSIAPVPLEGEYAISVSSGNLYWLSDEIKLTEEKPLYELDISLPGELTDIRGQLLDPDGNPIAGAGFQIHTSARYGGRTRSNDRWSTDQDGRFELKGLNPDRSMKYRISFDAPGFISKGYDLKIGSDNRIVLERGLIVEGTVYDKDTKLPVPGVKISFWTENIEGYGRFSVITNSQGRFIADRFKNVDYYYGVEKDGYPAIYRSSDKVNPAKDEDVELYIQKNLGN